MIDPACPPEVVEQFQKNYPGLALRVREGNDKLISAYLKIYDLDLTDPRQEAIYNASWDKITAAATTLSRLCLSVEAMEEVLHGSGECLYIMSGKKVRQCEAFEKTPKGQLVQTFCFACPSARPYWREEWSEFARILGER